MIKLRFWLIVLLLIVGGGIFQAQDDAMAVEVQVEANDGLTLVGDYYPVESDEARPAVLLFHMLGSNRSAYTPFIPALVEAGYHVVNADMRGHGATGGTQDWVAAEADVQHWLDWIREQEGIDGNRVAIIGASIGSNLAIIGCANDATCVTAIALSPGLDYRGVRPAESINNGLGERSVLLVASQGDRDSANSVKVMFPMASGNIMARLYSGGAHGTQLFNNDLESVANLSLLWLDSAFHIDSE